MKRIRETLFRVICIVLSCYVLVSTVKVLPTLQAHSVFLLLVLVAIFLQNPKGRKERPYNVAVDLLLCILVIICFGYVSLNHEAISGRFGSITPFEMVLGILSCFLIMESVRRTIGWFLVGIVMFFVLYTFLGVYLPYKLGGHGGFRFERVVAYVYLSENGVFGTVTYILFRYVFLFVIFGRLLQECGAMDFIMNLAVALFGRFRGGPALVAVITSGMFGSVSGSPMANVMVTGTVTIPLMKQIGFKPHIAGAVEAAASTGGQIIPPVMGATAFLIMQLLGTTYLNVIKAAVIPAILYYFACGISVYLYAIRANIPALSPSQLPAIVSTARQYAWESLTFTVGFVVLMGLLLLHYSPSMSALIAMIAVAVFSLPSKQRITPKKVMATLGGSAKDFASLGAAGACVGIMIAAVLLTGLAMRFSGIIILLAGGKLFLVLLFSMIASIILGCALPTPIVYLLLAIMVAPSLLEMGVPPMAAHFFIFYAGIMAFVTPPVCVAAYAGALLAKADYVKTGIAASFLSFAGYIVPFVFVYEPELLLMGSLQDAVLVAIRVATAISFLAGAFVEWPGFKSVELARRACFLLGGGLIALPYSYLTILGVALGLLGLQAAVRRGFVRGKEAFKRI